MTVLYGIPAAPGLAIGPVLMLHPELPVDLAEQRGGEAEAEIAHLEQAMLAASTRLEKLQTTASETLADILAAQREMLDDPELKEDASKLISVGSSAEAAITRVAHSYAEQLASLPDPYLAARAEDVHEIGRRIVAELRGSPSTLTLAHPSILVAQDLSPADVVGLDPRLVRAIVTANGSATGHLAIVAQGLDIPAVVGLADALSQIEKYYTLIVDGERGTVLLNPSAEQRAEVEQRLAQEANERLILEVYRDQPGLTADGVEVEVFANIGSLAEAQKAVAMGAQGVGLLRTELLAAQGLPTEDAQFAIYNAIGSLLHRPLIVRTFDIGGDKPVPGLDIPAEANPFLGWRGIRLSLDRPEEVFLPQVRALLRASITHDIRLMLPMITDPQEVTEARALIAQARRELEAAGHALRPIPLGIMVETPAAALTLDQFRELIDFASIGTNDLVQYTYAVDRTNLRVRGRAQALGLATLRLIQCVCQTGIPIAVCGQLAADPTAIPLLVGLGVRELSVTPARIPAVKQILSRMSLAEMQTQAREALAEK